MTRSPPQISIEQYAGIRAALDAGHPLERVLGQEGVPGWRWPDLDLELADAITADDELFRRYRAALAEAEDNLAARVDPLDDDLRAWTGFVAALAVGGDRLLARHGLRAGDLAPLQRRWQKRFESDSRARDEARSLAARPPSAPTTLQVERASLRPFRWSPGSEQAAAACRLEPLAFLAETERAKRGPSAAAIPFGGSRPAPPGTLAIEPHAAFGRTASAGPRAPTPATPFEPPPPAAPPAPAAPPPPTAPPPPAAPPAAAPMPLEPQPLLATTAPASLSPPRPALPFAGAKPAPPRAALEPHPAHGQTAPLERTLEPVASLGATLVTRAPGEAWSPEDYAAFCAALDAAGPRRAEVLARWGVPGEEACALLERSWRERFEAAPALRERFVAALRKATRGGT